jgi:hypothetical protein
VQKVDVPVSNVAKISSVIAEDVHTERVRGATNTFSDTLHGLGGQQADLEAAAHWGKITEVDIKALESGDIKAVSPELAEALKNRAADLNCKKLNTEGLIPEFKKLVSELNTEFTSYKEAIESRFDDLADAFSTPHLGSVAAEATAAQGLGQMEALISEARHFSDLPGLVQSLISELRKFEKILVECRNQRGEFARVAAAEGEAQGMEELRAKTLPARNSNLKLLPEAAPIHALDDGSLKGKVA